MKDSQSNMEWLDRIGEREDPKFIACVMLVAVAILALQHFF
jgi:hypothetical protein